MDMVRRKADESAREIDALMAHARQLEDKLVLLMQYRDDYHARYRATVLKGMGGADLENYHLFLEKLDTAIAQQRSGVAQLQTRVKEEQARWTEARRKLESYEVLHRRRERAEAQRLARHEQRTHDEHSAKTHRLRGSETPQITL
jgi:flagellar FliJ protein